MAAWTSSPFTTLPTSVATASAKPAFPQKTVAASASPKLKAWLNTPELVAIPTGNSVSLNPNLFDKGASPTPTAISIGSLLTAETSPPSSTTAILQPSATMSSTARSANTPATAAIGPTPAFNAASAISLTTNGSAGTFTGISDSKNRRWLSPKFSSSSLLRLIDSTATSIALSL